MVFALHQYESAVGKHVSLPSRIPLPPPSPPQPSRLSQSTSFVYPMLYIKLPLTLCLQTVMYVSMVLPQIIPPSPSIESRSLFFMSVPPLLLYM